MTGWDARPRSKTPDTGTWRYGYDALGRLTRQTDAVGNRLTFSYDLAGRLTQQQGAPPDGTAYTTGWSYDSLDRPVTLTYPDGEVSPPDMGRTGCQ